MQQIKEQVESASKKYYDDFPPGYVPGFIQVHDEEGLILEIKNMEITQSNNRPKNKMPEIICWYFDGFEDVNIAYVHSSSQVIIDRISANGILNKINQELS